MVLGVGGFFGWLFCFERNLQTFSYPLFLIWHGTFLQLVLLSPCLRKKRNFKTTVLLLTCRTLRVEVKMRKSLGLVLKV